MKKTELQKKLNIKFKKFNVFRYDDKTKKSELLGVVIASGSPDAIMRGWKKFKIPHKNYEMKMIYARRKEVSK